MTQCCICGETSKTHEHHIVPRCFGGLHGPTVFLCPTDHGLVHELADAKTPLEEIGDPKVRYLVGVIYRAQVSTKDDPNRRRTISFTLTGTQHRTLVLLTNLLDKTQPEVLLQALDELSRRHIRSEKLPHPKKPTDRA